jgi:hypothetical protein
VSSPADPGRPDAAERVDEVAAERADEVAAELNDPSPAPSAHEPGKQAGATASERASAQTAAELSDR